MHAARCSTPCSAIFDKILSALNPPRAHQHWSWHLRKQDQVLPATTGNTANNTSLTTSPSRTNFCRWVSEHNATTVWTVPQLLYFWKCFSSYWVCMRWKKISNHIMCITMQCIQCIVLAVCRGRFQQWRQVSRLPLHLGFKDKRIFCYFWRHLSQLDSWQYKICSAQQGIAHHCTTTQSVWHWSMHYFTKCW